MWCLEPADLLTYDHNEWPVMPRRRHNDTGHVLVASGCVRLGRSWEDGIAERCIPGNGDVTIVVLGLEDMIGLRILRGMGGVVTDHNDLWDVSK